MYNFLCVSEDTVLCISKCFLADGFLHYTDGIDFFMNEMKFESRNYGKSISIVLNEMLWMYQMSIIYWNLPIMSWIIDAPLISNEKCIRCHHLFRCICKQIIDCTLQIIFEIQLFLIRLHSMFIHTHSHSEFSFQNAFIDTISIQCSFFIHFIFLVIDCFKVFKAGKMHCRKSNGKNRPNEKLNRTQRKNKCYRMK